MRLDQNEQLASLVRDLETVVAVGVDVQDDRDDHARVRLVYGGISPGLFGVERSPELDVGRLLRKLAERRRLTIEADDHDGKRVRCRLPSRVEVHVELVGFDPLI